MRFVALALVACAAFALLASGSVSIGFPVGLVVLNTSTLQSGQLPEGWRLKVNRGTPDIATVASPAGTVIRLKSDRASFALERSMDLDPAQYPVLSWTWKVTRLPEGGDFRRSRTDDQAAQVLVAFSDRHILSYVWDTSAPKGAVQTTSLLPLIRIAAMVCRSGMAEANQWLSESRDLAHDYEAAFGGPVQRIKGIRLQINSQHTGTRAESYFGEVAFREKAR